MASNAGAVQVRVELANVGNVGGQRAHDLRIGPQPGYVVAARTPLNRILVKPLHGAELRAICLDRRARRETRRAMRHNVAVALIGIVTFGHRAQALFEALDAEGQDAAYRAVVEALAERLGTSVSGLVVHCDESAPPCALPAPRRDPRRPSGLADGQGRRAPRPSDHRRRGDGPPRPGDRARHPQGPAPGSGRGLCRRGEPLREGAPRRPARRDRRPGGPRRGGAREGREERAPGRDGAGQGAEDDARADRAAKRAQTYEHRAEDARAELDRLSAEVARLRGLAEAAEARRADEQAVLDRVSGTLATARRDLADVDAALAQKKTTIAGLRERLRSLSVA